jgi:hypothetical protein
MSKCPTRPYSQPSEEQLALVYSNLTIRGPFKSACLISRQEYEAWYQNRKEKQEALQPTRRPVFIVKYSVDYRTQGRRRNESEKPGLGFHALA